jgi:hypothetical protein
MIRENICIAGRRSIHAVSLLSAVLLASVAAQANEPELPLAGQIGTTEVLLNDLPAKRLGIVAYCADMAPGADEIGLQDGGPVFRVFDIIGKFGAKNILDYYYYDDGIDRPRDVVLVDGDREQPTAETLIRNFDVVLAYTDNKCGIPIPSQIANQAAKALADFAAAPGKGLILTGFAFSSSIGFGKDLFKRGLSPIGRGGPDLVIDCTRETPCPIGVCPDGTVPDGVPPTCLVVDSDPPEYLSSAVFQPHPPGVPNEACDNILINVRGPTSSSWATKLTSQDVAKDATLCFNYDGVASTVPFLAINQAQNIIAINAFPADSKDIQKFWFGCIFGNAYEFLARNHVSRVPAP